MQDHNILNALWYMQSSMRCFACTKKLSRCYDRPPEPYCVCNAAAPCKECGYYCLHNQSLAYITMLACRYMLGSNQGSAGSEDQAAATTAVTEALAAIHVVQAYNLQVRVLTSTSTQQVELACWPVS